MKAYLSMVILALTVGFGQAAFAVVCTINVSSGTALGISCAPRAGYTRSCSGGKAPNGAPVTATTDGTATVFSQSPKPILGADNKTLFTGTITGTMCLSGN